MASQLSATSACSAPTPIPLDGRITKGYLSRVLMSKSLVRSLGCIKSTTGSPSAFKFPICLFLQSYPTRKPLLSLLQPLLLKHLRSGFNVGVNHVFHKLHQSDSSMQPSLTALLPPSSNRIPPAFQMETKIMIRMVCLTTHNKFPQDGGRQL